MPFTVSFVLIVAAAGSLLVLGFFLAVDLGGTVTGTVHPLSFVVAAVWAGPFWIYARMVRTRTGSLTGGAGLLAATAASLVALFRDTHSTAGIGVLTIPMLMYPFAAGVLAIDRLLLAPQTDEPPLRGFVRRLLAVGLSFVVMAAAISTMVGIANLFDPVTSDDLVGSLIMTVVSAVAATGGVLAIKRLWRVTPPSSVRRRLGP